MVLIVPLFVIAFVGLIIMIAPVFVGALHVNPCPIFPDWRPGAPFVAIWPCCPLLVVWPVVAAVALAICAVELASSAVEVATLAVFSGGSERPWQALAHLQQLQHGVCFAAQGRTVICGKRQLLKLSVLFACDSQGSAKGWHQC
jgi:hypothetical protein